MLAYQRLKKNRRKFLALTGLTPKEFRMLLPVFSEVYEQARVDTTQRGTGRRRPVGGGRKGQLRTAEQKLLVILVYPNAYPPGEKLNRLNPKLNCTNVDLNQSILYCPGQRETGGRSMKNLNRT